MAEFNIQNEPSDTCERCGLRRATREMEAKGIKPSIRLCDDCYWGKEPLPGLKAPNSASQA
jgi:hypothetical protein